MKIVAQRLRALRESTGVSQVKMAKHIGIIQSSVNRYETGAVSPSLETLLKYADYFDVSLDYIFGRTNYPKGILYEHRSNNPEMERLVEMCFDSSSPLNKQLKETIMEMIREAEY